MFNMSALNLNNEWQKEGLKGLPLFTSLAL